MIIDENDFHKDFSEILALMTTLSQNESQHDISIDYIREINSKFDQIINDVDSYKENLKQKILDNFNNVPNTTPITNKKHKTKSKKKKQIDNHQAIKSKKSQSEQAAIAAKSFKKIEQVTTELEIKSNSFNKSMNTIISKISSVESMTDQIKNKPLSEIISVEETLKIKGLNRFYLTLNKNNGNEIDLRWDKVDQSTKAEIIYDTLDKSLKINSNSCYNWFRTDLWFSNEDFEVTFLVQLPNSSNNSFYFGVINESVRFTTSCMCCSIKDATYFTRNGKVANSSGIKTTEPELDYTQQNDITIRVRVLMSTEEVYFGIEERDMKGPYQSPIGDKLKVVAGACGKATDIRVDIIKSFKI